MALFGRLTATEYLHFVGRMYGLDKATTDRRTEELLEFMQLANETKKLVTDFLTECRRSWPRPRR